MGRHAAPMTEAAMPSAFAAPVPAPTPAPAVFAPATPTTIGYTPALGGYAPPPFAYPPAPTAVRDDFTAINLLVPQQQTLPVRALVWGIVSVLLPVAIAPSVFAIVFGILGVRRARRLEDAGLGARGRGMSVAGLVLGIMGAVALLLAIVGVVLLLAVASHPPVGGYPS